MLDAVSHPQTAPDAASTQTPARLHHTPPQYHRCFHSDSTASLPPPAIHPPLHKPAQSADSPAAPASPLHPAAQTSPPHGQSAARYAPPPPSRYTGSPAHLDAPTG